jgi:3-(3-hydroxy-phenyl)propionate hydroxylase
MAQVNNQDDVIDVLIVGAGPVGLTLAADLLRLGVQFRILETRTEPEKYSKAGNLWPRTQEVFAAIGVIDRLLAESVPIRTAALYAYGKLMGHVTIDGYSSPHGTPVMIGQNRVERILSDHLAQAGQPVERGVTFTDLHQNADYVEATVEGNGKREIVRCRFLVACDGNKSRIRNLIGLSIHPERLLKRFMRQIDARVRWNRSVREDQIWFFLFDTGYIGVLPLPEGYHRFWIIEDEEGVPDRDPTLEEMQEVVRRITGDSQVELYDPIWFSHGRFQHGVAPALRKDRVILAGDAGHIPVPISGKGMNTGIQDAFNLGWKLAATLREQVSPVVLDSYSVERQKVRMQLDAAQISGFHWIMEPSKIQQLLVRRFGSVWLNLVAARFFKQRLPQLDIAYPNSFLTEDHLNKGVRAGDRAPDATVVAVPGQHTITLFQLIYKGLDWTLLLFDNAQGGKILEQLQAIAKVISKEFIQIRAFPVLADSNVLKKTEQVSMLFDFDCFAHKAFGIKKPSLVLIRPDGHVAFRASATDYKALQIYARRVFQVQPQTNHKLVSEPELAKSRG